jgi:hypothetical protein
LCIRTVTTVSIYFFLTSLSSLASLASLPFSSINKLGDSKMEARNRHPVDRLADVRSEIKRLEEEERELRAYLLEHPQDRTGAEFLATIGEQRRSRVDLKALAGEIRHSLLQRFTRFASCRTVRLREREPPDA